MFHVPWFQLFMRNEHSEKKILFWKQCEMFRAEMRDRRRLARSIVCAFVNNSAPCQVNIDDDTRRRIECHLACAPTYLFDDAQQLVRDLMKRDTYRRFVASRLYKEAVREAELQSVVHGGRSVGQDSFATKNAKFQQR
jgi:Regulator of G protein signaling domain